MNVSNEMDQVFYSTKPADESFFPNEIVANP